MLYRFIEALKNGESLDRVKTLIQDFKIDIKAEYRHMLVHLVVVFNKPELYETVNEFFDGTG